MMDDIDSSASSDFFSPISASFFHAKHTKTSDDRLPSLHDSSWIGARLSPIGSFDHEQRSLDEHDDDQRLVANYHRALNDSLEVVNERTNLLGRGFRIHQTWESPLPAHHSPRNQRKFYEKISWGTVVLGASGILLLSMAAYDMYRWRRGMETAAWVLPWIGPPRTTFERFGAFNPSAIQVYSDIWISFSSLFLTYSLAEWGLLLFVWNLLLLKETVGFRWAGVYCGSSFAGQIWMFAFDHTTDAVAGCVSWGTAGVLCANGMALPDQRCRLFCGTMALIYVSFLQRPNDSVMGAVGGMLFGWALGLGTRVSTRGVGKKDRQSFMPWTCLALAPAVVLIPGLHLFFCSS